MTTAFTHSALIGVDWGLTHLRAYRIAEHGHILQQRESTKGISAIASRAFSAALHELIDDWLAEAWDLPLYLCGMIGSRNGWYEAPYNPCPAKIQDVAASALPIDINARHALLIGGLSFASARGTFDVIRGEETQIFGVARAEGSQFIVTPGTHSKWVAIGDGAIERFRTYMTGELYAVLSRHSSLGWWMKEASRVEEDAESFLEGVHASLEDPDLLHSLFTVRSRALFRNRSAAEHAAYLSGILIGNEIAEGLKRHRPDALTLIASARLERLYSTALSVAGIGKVECVAGDWAVARGLWRLWQCRTQR
jgi:2-dehydro-3-deoxygalactonokinase